MTKTCFKTSFSFGLASGVITTLGLMIGLYSSTFSRGVVLGGILTISIADSCSDAVGIHFSEESEGVHTHKEVWTSTFYTFISKFFVTLSFLPIMFLASLKVAMILDIIWGFLLLSLFSYFVSKQQNNSPLKAILEHISMLAIVIAITYFVGRGIDKLFIK